MHRRKRSCQNWGEEMRGKLILIGFLFANLFGEVGICNKPDEITAQAPPNHEVFKHTATGVVYIPSDLAKKWEQLQRELESSNDELKHSPSESAREKSARLLQGKQELEQQIEKKQVLVEPFNSYQRRETIEIGLSESGNIVITSDEVRIRGWNGDKIKCVVEKFILGTEQPSDGEFSAIKVEHQIRDAADLVGKTAEARAKEEAKYLASEQGRQLSPEALKSRGEILRSIDARFEPFTALQGKPCNILSIKGLTFQEGNQHMSGATKSLGGGATSGGYWKRSAQVTIYVPKCANLVVRGCQKLVDIKSVHSNLILTTDGSQDLDYDSKVFSVVDHHGDVDIYDAPIQRIHKVVGSVNVRQLEEFVNTHTLHTGGMRKISREPPRHLSISEVNGNLTANVIRADLVLGPIDGIIDVVNEYGDTSFQALQQLEEAAHRIVSHSGKIELVLAAQGLGIPLYAYSQVGEVEENLGQDALRNRMFSTSSRSWHGFETPAKGGPGFFLMTSRPSAAWHSEDRKPGLDLVSVSGSIVVGTSSN